MGAVLHPSRIGGVAVLRNSFAPGAGALLTTGKLRNNTGSVLAFRLLRYLAAYDANTHELAVLRTGVYTDGNGIARVRDPGAVEGGLYSFDWETVDGERRMPRAGATA